MLSLATSRSKKPSAQPLDPNIRLGFGETAARRSFFFVCVFFANIRSWPSTSFTALQKCGRYRINSGQTAPSGLTGSATFNPKQPLAAMQRRSSVARMRTETQAKHWRKCVGGPKLLREQNRSNFVQRGVVVDRANE
jgi:hypothetical protein